MFDNWYTSAEAGCSAGTGTCSITPQNKLSNGSYQWWVLGFNSFGSGERSSELNFTVETSSLGFDSQFNANAAGWTTHTGTWKIENSQYYTAQGPASTPRLNQLR